MSVCSNLVVAPIAAALVAGVALWDVGAPSPGAAVRVGAVGAQVQPADPVSGEWEGELSGEQLPQAFPLTITLALDAEGRVSGGFTVDENTAEFDGVWNAAESLVTGTMLDPESGEAADVELRIDGNSLEGTLTVTGENFTVVLDVHATRGE